MPAEGVRNRRRKAPPNVAGPPPADLSELRVGRPTFGDALRYEHITYELADSGVATITLAQPETRNALSSELLDELIAAFEAARGDDGVRCVVLASSHDRVFSSGANLGGFAAEVPLVHKHLGTDRFPRLFRLIGELGKPTICAASGHVLAGALGIALACDLVIAKDGAEFGTPEINVGAFPFMIMALIYRNVPRKRATEMLLLGERLSAGEARDAGIVNRVVAPDAFDAAVEDWATKLASKSPIVMRLGKDAIFRSLDMPLLDALDYLRAQLSLALSTDDVVEGVTAFFEKREPVWKGR
jgi:enoyl-CoA hydratase